MIDRALVATLVERLDAVGRRRLGRSLALLHLSGGGSGGCALELRMLDSAVHDLARHGLRFVDGPREADVLLLTGPLTRTMAERALRTWEAMAAPRWVVALGDCAVDGGVFRGSYAVLGGADAVLPVDLVIRGCPPAPEIILNSLRALVEANRSRVDEPRR